MSEAKRVNVYAVGLCYASACVAEGVEREEVEREANATHPTGVGPWRISADETFADGSPHPKPCEAGNGRTHYLLEC